MCGRMSLGDLTANSLHNCFTLEQVPPIPDSYNVAPSQSVPVVRQQDGSRGLELLHWGLIPHWSKDPEIARHTFNARVETLTEKPSFRDPFKSKRCIVTASGFYEWRKEGQGKKPFYIYRADKSPLAFAGLWDRWVDKGSGELIESCSIVTREACGPMSDIHQRMPAILETDSFTRWLDPQCREAHVLRDLLVESSPELEMYPVSSYVSNARNDGVGCVERG